MTPTPISEEANDLDHITSDQVTTEPRRSTRVRSVMTHKYRGSIVVLSISKSVEPNKEQKEMISCF